MYNFVMRRLILTVFAVFFLSFVVKTSVLAAPIHRKDIEKTYTVASDGVNISEKRTLSIISEGWYISAGTEESILIPNANKDDTISEEISQTIGSLAITDSDGRNLEFSYTTDAKNNISIKTYVGRDIYFGSQYSIIISYKSSLLFFKSGLLSDLYIPGLAEGFSFETENSYFSFASKVLVPKSLGEINFVTPVAPVEDRNEFWEVNFAGSSLIGKTGWVQIGIKQLYTFNIKQPYFATSPLPITFNTFKTILPGNIEKSKVTQETRYIKIDPTPYMIEEDKDGNIIATFKIPSNAAGEILIEGYSMLQHNKSISTTIAGKIADIPESIAENNTKPGDYWEVDAVKIKETAQTIKNSLTQDMMENEIAYLTKKTYEYVINQIDYSQTKRFGLNERQGALATLNGGAAVCMEYTDLFVTLMRAMGVPARAAFGYGYSTLDPKTLTDNTINHQWAEVYYPYLGSWVPVDTTWGENGNEIIGGDLNHFYSHVASIGPEIPAPTEFHFFGQGNNLEDRIFEIRPASSIDQNEETKSIAELKALYPTKDATQIALDSISMSVKNIFSTIDFELEKLLIPNVDQNNLTTVKTVIYFSPIILIAGFVILKIIIKKRKRVD